MPRLAVSKARPKAATKAPEALGCAVRQVSQSAADKTDRTGSALEGLIAYEDGDEDA